MPVIHFFGDSFTRGDGTLASPLYLPNVDQTLHWTEYVANAFKYTEIKNYATQGASNDEIFMSILEVLTDFKKGDMVIVGQTF